MYDAMHAVSRGAVPEISKGSPAEGDEDYTTPKGLFLRRAAVRIGWLLVFVLRNTSASATPLDLMYCGDRATVSRLVTEDDGLTSEHNPKFVCRVPDFTSCRPCLRVSRESSFSGPIRLTAVACKHDGNGNWHTAQAWGVGFGSASFMPVGGGNSPFSIVQQGFVLGRALRPRPHPCVLAALDHPATAEHYFRSAV
ncbi:hypothetical protein [Bradyrhizobium icense]|uniref:hypothetical protein n=1 Tax=Bradyrhizobium icense TaxID=1274631 RepID=UPI0012EA9A42|nr:hypothetical protein [Bradyrhizobium icense]